MGDRFYREQIETLGTCPGLKTTKRRKRRMAWDEDKKTAVVKAYESADPTPETSMEIVTDLAEEYDESPNGVRMILTKAGVYVKKAPSTPKSTGSGDGDKPARVSKADAQSALTEAIEAIGATADEDIISRMTGKAALYFVEVLGKKDTD